jgi:hypothetical protein
MLLIDSALEIFKIELIDYDDFFELVMRFVFNFLVIFLITRGIYYPKTRRRDFFFTFILVSVVVFFMCFLLENVKLQLGFALGLFAVFGIIRYRTDTIPIKEMTYLFIVIGLSVMNALANKKISYAELVFANLSVVLIAYFVERLKGLEPESSAIIDYDKIELISPDSRNELMQDLESRLGVKLSGIEIVRVDYVRKKARIKVFFKKQKKEENQTYDNSPTS